MDSLDAFYVNYLLLHNKPPQNLINKHKHHYICSQLCGLALWAGLAGLLSWVYEYGGWRLSGLDAPGASVMSGDWCCSHLGLSSPMGLSFSRKLAF